MPHGSCDSQQSPVFSIKDLEHAAQAERQVVNQAKLRNRASTFTLRAFPSDGGDASAMISPPHAPRRISQSQKLHARSVSHDDATGLEFSDVS